MVNYIIRRIGYGVLILIGVNIFTFLLFFTVNTPDDMARMNIGGKRVTQDAIDKWKVERGYDKPLFWNGKEEGARKLTNTIFVEHSARLFLFDFGASDSGRGPSATSGGAGPATPDKVRNEASAISVRAKLCPPAARGRNASALGIISTHSTLSGASCGNPSSRRSSAISS